MEINDQNIWSDEPTPTPAPAAETPVVTPAVETPAVPATETPIVETPAPVLETTDAPIIDGPPVINEITPAPETPKEIIVEKYPDMDEHQRNLFEAFQKGDEDSLYNYLDEKRRDYNAMSDYDVVRAGLKKDNPDWTDKRIDLEFKTKYEVNSKKDLPDETVDPDGYDRAVAFNEVIDQREALLEMHAEDYRSKLNSAKKDIQLPKIQETTPVTAEAPTPSPEDIQAWKDLVTQELPTVSDIKLTINGEEVIYKVTDEERTGLGATLQEINPMEFLMKERKWLNEDGTPNVKNMAEDVYKFRNLDKMLSSVATRAKNEATKTVITEIRNIDLTKNGVDVASPKVDVGEKLWNY